MVGAGLDEDGVALGHRDALALDLEHARPFEDDVDLVVVVGLLPVGLGRDEDVDAELDARATRGRPRSRRPLRAASREPA